MELDFYNTPTDKNWTVLYTKSRHEKKVAEFCRITGILNYLPLEKRILLYGRKKVTTMMPLFPGYLFCCIDLKERYDLLMTHDIARIIQVAEQAQLKDDLKRLYAAQNGELDLRPCQYYKMGQKVKILSGPLSGHEGIVQRIKGHNRLVLKVDFIRQAASVEVEQFAVAIMN